MARRLGMEGFSEQGGRKKKEWSIWSEAVGVEGHQSK